MYDDISNEKLKNRLNFRAEQAKACYILIEKKHDITSVVKGIAHLLKSETLINFIGDRFTPEESELIKQSLYNRKTIIIFCDHPTDFLPGLAKMWGKHLEYPRNSSSRYYYFNFDSIDPENLGALFIVQQVDNREDIYPAIFHPFPAWYLDIGETNILETLGVEKNIAIKNAGRNIAQNLEKYSTKQLFYLYELDPPNTKETSLDIILTDRNHRITWTDVRLMLREDIDQRFFDRIYKQNRLEKEKYDFALSALDFLDIHKGQNNNVYENIYEVVWRHRFLQFGNTDYLFRGQYNVKWPLQSSLLRRKNDGSPLDIQTMLDRVLLTNEFLFELENIQEKLFGKTLDENSLLAIAQHFGFATPLLDYSFSLRVAAFFATYDAKKMTGMENVIGVIYYFRNYSDAENALRDPGKHLDFSLFDLAHINIGNLQLILPDIPDEDNRIMRQKGAFVTDFSGADLKNVSIDRIYFKQQKNEVFQDRLGYITEDILLTENSRLTQLAEKIKNKHENKTLYSLLGNTNLHEQSVIGSNGSFLWSIVNESNSFFERLSKLIKQELTDDDLMLINNIFTDYFTRIGLQNDIGEIPDLDIPFGPITIAVDQLAEWAEADQSKLWVIVNRELEDGFSYFKERKSWQPNQESLDSGNAKEHIAVMCAYYLVAFEYLINVDGTKARKMIFAGMSQDSILSSWQLKKLNGNSKQSDMNETPKQE